MFDVYIMAAGVGSRISRHINGTPKCLLSVNGEPLLNRNIDILKKQGASEIHVIAGYQFDKVSDAIGSKANIHYNPCFRVSNSIVSLYTALINTDHSTEHDLLLINGDVFFENALATTLCSNREKITFFGDSTRIVDADYKLGWSKEGILLLNGKDLSIQETTGEYLGAAYIPQSYVKSLREFIRDDLKAEKINNWWEDVIYDRKNLLSPTIIDVAGKFWAEFDFIEDFQRTNQFLLKNKVDA